MLYDLAIVGAGTAGLSAAIYAARAGLSVLVFEGAMYGGQIIVSPTIENYPGIGVISGADFANNLYAQAEQLGVTFAFETVNEVIDSPEKKVLVTDMDRYEAKTLILATGAKNRQLGLAGEDRLTGRGISYCATCDGSFFQGKTVAVMGGGNTALEDAEVLSKLCSKVYLIHRRSEFRGEAAQVERLKKLENVEFILDSTIVELQGENALTGVVIEHIPTKQTRLLELDGLFVAIGQVPQNAAFANLVQTDSHGYIVAGEDCHTNLAGVYAAGDGRTKTVRQLVTAAADGAVAALAAAEYIRSL